MSNVLVLMIPTVSIGFGCFFLYTAWKYYYSTRNVNNWELAQGTITKSNLKHARAALLPDIEYQYFVLGVEYKGTAVTIVPDLFYDVKVAQGFLAEYPVGKKVDVFYNPEIHHVAVLEKESSVSILWFLWLPIGTALAFLIFGFASLLHFLYI